MPTPYATVLVHTDQGPLQLPQGSTLADAVTQLLSASGRHPASVATAVNGHFVPRPARETHLLQSGDTVLCFSPITGG